MKYQEIFDKVRSLFAKNTGVEMSFGKPVEVNDLSIVPVARVSFGMGFGGGSSFSHKQKDRQETLTGEAETDSEEKPPVCEGGGGGGGMKTVPVGLYTIKGEKVRFYPVVSFSEIIVFFGVTSFIAMRMMKRKCKKVKCKTKKK